MFRQLKNTQVSTRIVINQSGSRIHPKHKISTPGKIGFSVLVDHIVPFTELLNCQCGTILRHIFHLIRIQISYHMEHSSGQVFPN